MASMDLKDSNNVKREPPKKLVRQLSKSDIKKLERSNSAPIAFNMGNHVPMVRSNVSGRASQTMRQDFLEQAIHKDSNGTIHVEDFGNLLHPPTSIDNWVPNSASDGCQRCKRIFGYLRNRRHHCRYCGLLVCFKCSQARVVFHVDADPVRVCIRCMFKIVGRIDALYTRRYMRAVLSNNNNSENISAKDLLIMRETTEEVPESEEEESDEEVNKSRRRASGSSGGGGGNSRRGSGSGTPQRRRHSSADFDSVHKFSVLTKSISFSSGLDQQDEADELTTALVRRLTDAPRMKTDSNYDEEEEEEDDDAHSIVVSDKGSSLGDENNTDSFPANQESVEAELMKESEIEPPNANE